MPRSSHALGALAFGLLLVAIHAHAQVPPNPLDYSRTQSYTYTPQMRVLTETVEPGSGENCFVTTFGYDAYGNKSSTVRSNCAGATGNTIFPTQTSSAAFAAIAALGITTADALSPNVNVAVAAGLFATTKSKGAGATLRSTTLEIDPRFGVQTKLTDANAIVSRAVLDDFGRAVRRIAADGTYVDTKYCVLSGAGTASNSPSCPVPASAEVPADAYGFVQSEPKASDGSKLAGMSRVYSDRAGRTLRTVQESFDGTAQPAAYKGVAVVTDTVYNQYGVAELSTAPYFLSTVSPSTTGANDAAVTKRVVDWLGREVGMFKTDPSATGVNKSQTLGAFGTRIGAWSTTEFRGTTVIRTNDKGRLRKEEFNALGAVSRVTDDQGSQLAFSYEAWGNVAQIKDAAQNSTTQTWDLRGNLRSKNDPDLGLLTYTYDAIGQLRVEQNPVQRAVSLTTTYTYDELGRRSQRGAPEFNSNWYFDKFADGTSCGWDNLCESTTTTGVRRRYAYDSLMRPTGNRADLGTGGATIANSVTYDALTGRVASYTYPTGLTVQPTYTTNGYQEKLLLQTSGTGVVLSAGTALWTAGARNAAGAIEKETLSNGISGRYTFDNATGRTAAIVAGAGTATNVLNHSYGWDSLGNLTSRNDANGDGTSAVTEVFSYDPLNRLVGYRVDGAAMTSPFYRAVSLQYNALGQLLFKSDVGTYTYGTAGLARPHTLTSVAPIGGGAATTYTADVNGNITGASAGSYTSLAYTSFNMPKDSNGVVGPAATYSWVYDESLGRIKQLKASGVNTRTTWYFHPDAAGGLAFESESNTSPASQSHRHFLSAGGRPLGVLSSSGALPALTSAQLAPPAVASVALAKVEFWHTDHLGSIAATTDAAGGSLQRYSYDPFGKRRFTTGGYDTANAVQATWSTATANGTGRGFTSHEEMDDVGIVHMNGRLYDDRLGLFVQADPATQYPQDLQNYNRYAYVRNNPLNAKDPSGFNEMGDGQTLDSVLVTGEARLGEMRTSQGGGGATASVGAITSNWQFSGKQFRSAIAYAAKKASDRAVVVSVAEWLALKATLTLGLLTFGNTGDPNEDARMAVINAEMDARAKKAKEAASATGENAVTGTEVSTMRRSQPGEIFLRYESDNSAFSRITLGAGVVPGTYAAPIADGITPVEVVNSRYALPSPEIPRAVVFEIKPPAGTWIIGPRPVVGGFGTEVIFPAGVAPGSVSPPMPTPRLGLGK